MVNTTTSTRVAFATVVASELLDSLRAEFPDVTFDYADELIPPQRWVADHAGDPAFIRSSADEERFSAILAQADVMYGLPREDPGLLAAVVRANPKLRWVQGMAAGTGAQVRAAALSADELERVAFTTTAGVHAGPLAEYAVFGLLCGAKNLTRLAELKADRQWPDRWAMGQLSEQSVLVVGYGRIGQAIGQKAHALGARILAANASQGHDPIVTQWFDPSELKEAVAQADAVALALPDAPGTAKLIDAGIFAAMRPGTTLVNVGRGTVVDEVALLHALDSEQVGLAVLDVFSTEPLPASSPLWDHPHVIVSPHTAGLNGAEDRLIVELFARNLRRFLNGEELINRVNTVDFY